MERQRTEPQTPDPWLDAWDAVPRDGPAVFVIDTEAYDQRQEVRGRWIDPRSELAIVELQLQELLGRWPELGNWAVVDQINVGDAMVPEEASLDELARLTPPPGAQP